MTTLRSEAEPLETGLDDHLIKWIPLVVPLAALFLVTMVALIGFEVL